MIEIENRPSMGIQPHINLEYPGVNRDAQPGDSIFAQFAGKAGFVHPIEVFMTYVDVAKKNPLDPQKPLLHALAEKLITDPSQIPFFWNQLEANQTYAVKGKEMKNELLPELKKAASEVDTFSLTEDQVVSLFKGMHSGPESSVAHSKKRDPFTVIFSGLIQGTIHELMRDLKPSEIEAKLKSGKLTMNELQDTQNRIIHFTYILTSGVLKTHDETLMRHLHDFLSLKTSLLSPAHPNAGLFAAGNSSLDDAALAKSVLVDFTNVLLMNMYDSGSRIYVENLHASLEQSKTGSYYFDERERVNPKRRVDLTNYYSSNRYGTFAKVKIDDKNNPVEYYSRPLPFPENQIYSSSYRALSLEYFQLLSSYVISRGLLQYPMSIISLPDGSIRHIAPAEGDPFDIARAVLMHVSHTPQEVSGQYVIESFLTYLKPRLSEKTSTMLLKNNEQKKDNLISFPSHGIPSVGLTIAIDQAHNLAIEAESISIDKTGSRLDIKINNTVLHVRLNEKYELVSLTGGEPLSLSPETKIWWDHVILPLLHEYICVPPEKNEGYIDGVTVSPGETPQSATRRIMTERIGHLRRLGITPDGREKHHSIKQRDVVLGHTFLLPHIELLNLDEFNKKRPFGEKVTFVLPIEKELTKRPVFHLPHAYNETNALISGDHEPSPPSSDTISG